MGLATSRYLLCLISVDRWMITSRTAANRRQSSLKVARLLIIGGVLFLIIANIFECLQYVFDAERGCGPSIASMNCLLYTIYNITLSLGPLFILIMFSVLVLINIHHTGHRQVLLTTQPAPNNHIPNQRARYHKKDVQFIELSLIQVAGYILFNTLYGFITQKNIKTDDQ
jgi:hypothetical protein